jgi:hypothetical protein
MKILLTGILGGIVMFIWTSIAHMALPLGEAGIKEIPNERAVLDGMHSNIGEKSGFYLFPGPGVGADATRQEKREAMKAALEKMASGPSGLLIYHFARPFALGKSLGFEFVTEVIESILVVSLLAQTRIRGGGGRVGFVFVAGILAAVTTNIPYWNWYGFPTVYTVSYMFIQLVGFLCVGIVAGLILRNRA